MPLELSHQLWREPFRREYYAGQIQGHVYSQGEYQRPLSFRPYFVGCCEIIRDLHLEILSVYKVTIALFDDFGGEEVHGRRADETSHNRLLG